MQCVTFVIITKSSGFSNLGTCQFPYIINPQEECDCFLLWARVTWTTRFCYCSKAFQDFCQQESNIQHKIALLPSAFKKNTISEHSYLPSFWGNNGSLLITRKTFWLNIVSKKEHTFHALSKQKENILLPHLGFSSFMTVVSSRKWAPSR